MKISVVAVGLKMPKWADEACEDYLHRFPSDWKLELKTVKAEDRNTRTIPKVMQAEAERIRAALPKDAIKVIMDERGADPTSTKLAQQINRWGDQDAQSPSSSGAPTVSIRDSKPRLTLRFASLP